MITKVVFPKGATSVTIEPMHQWDYGRQLEIDVTGLPTVIEVHFACQGMTEAIAYACGVKNGVITVPVPNGCLKQTTPITAWIYVYEGDCSKTVRTIIIPVTARTKPPEHEDIPDNVGDRYTEVITQMNAVVDGLLDGSTPVKSAETATTAEKATTATTAESATVATSAVYATTAGRATTAIQDTEGAEIVTWYLKNRMNYKTYEANTLIDGGLIEFRITNNVGFTASVITNMQGYGGASLFGVTDSSGENRVARLRFEGVTSGQYSVYVDYLNDEQRWSVLDSSLYSVLYQYLSGVSNAGEIVGPSGGIVSVGTTWVAEEDVNNYTVTVSGGLSVYQDSVGWEVTAEDVGTGTVTVINKADNVVVRITTYTIVDSTDNSGNSGGNTGTSVVIPEVSVADNGKILGVVNGKWDKTDPVKELPDVTATDSGKVLGVVNGEWTPTTPATGTSLPTVGESDNGKVLQVTNGEWSIGDLPATGSVEIPRFDLTEMGLPVVPVTGEVKVLEHESAADICAALDRGSVKFVLTFETYGETEIIASKASMGEGVYHCSHAIIVDGTTKLITLTIEGDYISVFVGTVSGTGAGLPAVTESDNGKTLSVVGGAWSAQTPVKELPSVDSTDDGKVLKVSNGAWVLGDVTATGNAEIPFFDLAGMGLPKVPSDGTTADLAVDTTEIKSALDNGCVKFAVNAEDAGRVEIVMNKYSVDAYGIYLCLYNTPDGAFMLMIADGSLQAGVVPLTTLPDVTTDDNGKIMQVTNGVWSLATPATGGATIPAYDLTAMGLPTVTVGGGYVDLTTDTTKLRSDLASGSVNLTLTMGIGSYAIPVSIICNALVIDGAGEMYITFVSHIAGMVAHTSIDILDGRIQARSETLESIVTPYIDAYMEEALGGEF